MKGSIKTYLPEKGYGFILGDDGKDYFFHSNAFKNRDEIPCLCEELYIEFDQVATPKGYKAKNCCLLDHSKEVSYVVPNDFITSRSSGVKGWEVVDGGQWRVHGSSSHSPDSAKQATINAACQIGSNSLVNLEYYKTTGSTRGTGKGTYYFTIHNFRGIPVTLAKRNAKGQHELDSLIGINTKASDLKLHLLGKTKRSKLKRNIVWLCVLLMSLPALVTMPGLVIVLLILGGIFGRYSDYDSWLEKI